MLNAKLFIASLLSVLGTTGALSCACWNPGPSLTNSLFLKRLAVKVSIGNKIIKPTEPPVPFVDGEPDIQVGYLPESWLPSYFEAKITDIFKQDEYKGPAIKKRQKVVVQGGSCSFTPEEGKEYVLFLDEVYERTVPGKDGTSVVLTMPGYCDKLFDWDGLPEDRQNQLRYYVKTKKKIEKCKARELKWEEKNQKRQTRKNYNPDKIKKKKCDAEWKCWEGDCVNQNFVMMPVAKERCPDGTVAGSEYVCQYSESVEHGMCVEEMVVEKCPTPELIEPMPMPLPMPLPVEPLPVKPLPVEPLPVKPLPVLPDPPVVKDEPFFGAKPMPPVEEPDPKPMPPVKETDLKPMPPVEEPILVKPEVMPTDEDGVLIEPAVMPPKEDSVLIEPTTADKGDAPKGADGKRHLRH